MGTLDRLQAWYASHCDGEWEHQQGIRIETCDNPGWWVKINLAGTALAGMAFSQVSENVDEAGFQTGPRWFHCRQVNSVWEGAGDETALERILTTFLEWAEAATH